MINTYNVDVTTISSRLSSEKNFSCTKQSSRLHLATNDEYRNFVIRQLKLRKHHEGIMEKLSIYRQELLSVFLLDYEPAHYYLRRLYSKTKQGNKPCDPQVTLRSFSLMLAFKETSVTHWVNRIRTDPLLAIFCGTTTKKTPSIGTHYGLMRRFEDGFYQKKCSHYISPSEQRLKGVRLEARKEHPAKKKKVTEEEKNVIGKYAKETIAREGQPIVRDLEKKLNEFLHLVAVKPSNDKKIIDDLTNLTIAGDGSTIPSCAAKNGKPTCDCHSKGIYKCEHERSFSDIHAQWGWDNQVKGFVFGYRFWQLVCADNKHNLPIYLNINPANTHEGYMAIRSIDRFEKQARSLMPSMKIKKIALDALFDIHAIYDYLSYKDILYAIPYANPPGNCLTLGNDPHLFTDKGLPFCPGGLAMKAAGYDRQNRIMFHCPVKRVARREGKLVRVVHLHECPSGALCEPDSKMGPLVHVSCKINLRIFPKLARYSKEYKKLLAMRTCTERSNSAKKYEYKFKQTRTRVMSYAFCRLTFISILEHSKIWALEKIDQLKKEGKSIIEFFGL